MKNYLGLSSTFARALEVRMLSDFDIKFLIQINNGNSEEVPAMIENAKLLLRETHNPLNNGKYIYLEMHKIDFIALRSIVTNLQENKEHLIKRSELTLEAYTKPVYELNSTCEALLKQGYEKTDMSVKDFYEVIELAEIIAWLECYYAKKQVKVEACHIAEAIHYKVLAKYDYSSAEHGDYSEKYVII